MPIKIGMVGFKLPLVKAYIGGTEVYEEGGTVEPFSSNIAPTSWTLIEGNYVGEATNTYGTWKIYGDNQSSSTPVSYGFDGVDSTRYSLNKAVSNGTITLELPRNVAICPSQIYVKYSYCKSQTPEISYVQGYNVDNNTWENLGQLNYASDSASTFNLSITSYYSKFRVNAYNLNQNFGFALGELQIRQGNIKY